MTSALISSQLTERYLQSRGVEYFRGQHDSEYFFIVKAACGPLHVHLTDIAEGRSMIIQVTAPRFFAATHRRALMRLVRRWNRRGGLITAVLYRSVDPTRIGAVAQGVLSVGSDVGFDEFTDIVGGSIAGAAKFFGELAVLLAAAPSPQVWLPDAS